MGSVLRLGWICAEQRSLTQTALGAFQGMTYAFFHRILSKSLGLLLLNSSALFTLPFILQQEYRIQNKCHTESFVIHFLALACLMNGSVQTALVIWAALRPSVETRIATSCEPGLLWYEDRMPQAQNATVGRGLQSQLQDLDRNDGNFNRLPELKGEFKTPPQSLASHNHSGFSLRLFSPVYPVGHYFFLFSLPPFRQRLSSNKASRNVTYWQMRQNTK